MDNYTFKRISPELINDFSYIYEATHNKKISAEWFLKKFDTAAFGATNIGFIAYSQTGEPASFFGVLPVTVKYNDNEFIAAQGSELMTHPNHRKKGLFEKIFAKTVELARESGIEFFFAFPNQDGFSYLGFTKFGWINVHTTEANIIELKYNIISRYLNKLLPSINLFLQKRYKKKLSVKKDNLPVSINLKKDTFFIERNKIYFDYKIYSDNFFTKIPSGYLWLKVWNNILWVGDVFKLDDGTSDLAIIKDIKKTARKLKVHSILFASSPNNSLGKLFKRYSKKTNNLIFMVYKIEPDFEFGGMNFEYTTVDFDTF